MNESEIKKLIGETADSPSPGFTDRVMESVEEIASKRNRVPERRWPPILIAASVLLTVLGLFVRLPEFEILPVPAEVRYLFIPVIAVASLFFVAWNLFDASRGVSSSVNSDFPACGSL